MNTSTLRRIAPIAALFALLAAPLSLHAQTYTWSGGSGIWGNGTLWGGTVPNASDVTASLGGTAGTITFDASYTIGNLTFGGGGWTITGNSTTLLTLSTSSGTPTITNNNSGTESLNVGLVGTQGFTKSGAGGLKLGGTGGTLTGTITVSAGNISIISDTAISSNANIAVGSGAFLYSNDSSSSDTLTNSVTLLGGTFGIGNGSIYNGTITVGSSTVTTGTITHGNNNGPTVGGIITTGGSGSYTLTLSTSASGYSDLVIGSSIQNGSGTLAVTVSGSGTQGIRLTGSNTYTGATTVSSGRFMVTGSIASAVIVNSGGIFGGTGNSTQGVTVNSGGTFLGGLQTTNNSGTVTTSVGNFTTTGAASFASGSTFQLEFNSATATFSEFTASGFSLNGATLSLQDLGSSTLTLGQTFTIMDGTSSSITGTFAGLAEGSTITIGNNTFQVSYAADGGQDVTLTTVGAIPEPAATAAILAAVAALGCLIARRRRAARA